ncbi:TOBE domain-containing protein [Blastococcus brunescens]|uniref:TOBE domain-containing protein n=1 Tax=Blastococcus brunescens TaxID=1564165 RepID=A0ABZ1B7I2_9ACTN|nr:TOBE domain-containing protein [Blastococcus sp. BMG 8361]WRL66772.1 TOBE domain-containing protein [Blastococcus sp. BMG 8361]
MNRWPGRVKAPLFVGSHTEYLVSVGASESDVRLWSPRSDVVPAGSEAWVSVAADDVLVLPADDPTPPAAVASSTSDAPAMVPAS